MASPPPVPRKESTSRSPVRRPHLTGRRRRAASGVGAPGSPAPREGGGAPAPGRAPPPARPRLVGAAAALFGVCFFLFPPPPSLPPPLPTKVVAAEVFRGWVTWM